MGNYLNPGHTFTDGQTVTGPSLTEHVSEAIFKTTSITAQTLKDPAALTDQILVVAGDAFFKQTLQQIHNLILYPGSVVQTVYAEYTANTNLTTEIPLDDTIPQNTEGTEIISASITPRFATSTILASFQGQFALQTIQNHGTAALFRDSLVNAIAAQSIVYATGFGGVVQTQFHTMWYFNYMDSPATTSAVSYKIRVGPNAAVTMRLNGSANGRSLGGVSYSTLILQEIKV